VSQDPGVFDRDFDNPYQAPKAGNAPGASPYGSRHRYTGYAGFWVRFLAWFIDQIIVGIAGGMIGVIAGLMMVASGIDPQAFGPQNGLRLLGIAISLAYFSALESSSSQATLGKMALGLKVTDVHGRRLTFGNALGRNLAKILSGLILAIGYIMAAFDDRKQGLHDKIASTLVMKTR
jgi:uncharacterized RDD family membrane protein YckC